MSNKNNGDDGFTAIELLMVAGIIISGTILFSVSAMCSYYLAQFIVGM